MKMSLLIATVDGGYAEHLSGIISENYGDAIIVNVCSAVESLREYLAKGKYDVALLETSMIEGTDLKQIELPLLLWSDTEKTERIPEGLRTIRKYQRISLMVGSILEIFAKETAGCGEYKAGKACITAVWSPMGGVGKTTTALAYCCSRTASGRKALYLDLEPFSSVGVYFNETGRSISGVFEMLEAGEGNVNMLVRSICMQDSGSEITYLCRPDNFDDMNILTPENISGLLDACCELADEVVIDLSCACDERTRRVFEAADRILLVADASRTTQAKFTQFVSQHNVFQCFKDKTTLVANRGAMIGEALSGTVISLPYVGAADAYTVFKTLSAINFGA